MPLNTVGNRRISLVRDAEATIVTSSMPVARVRARADQHAAAVAPGVAERREGEFGDEFRLRRRTTARNGSSRSFEISATMARL